MQTVYFADKWVHLIVAGMLLGHPVWGTLASWPVDASGHSATEAPGVAYPETPGSGGQTFRNPDHQPGSGPDHPQLLNRDRYANHNPLLPSGYYEDIHSDLTYKFVYQAAYAASQARGVPDMVADGVAGSLAKIVAGGNLAADSQKMNAPGEVEWAGEYFREYNSFRRPGSEMPGISIAPHWYTTAEAEAALKAARAPFDFGVALHKYQDSFSHWQKLGKPDSAGEIWERHANNEVERFICACTPDCNPDDIDIDHYNPANDIDAAMTAGTKQYIEDYVQAQFGD